MKNFHLLSIFLSILFFTIPACTQNVKKSTAKNNNVNNIEQTLFNVLDTKPGLLWEHTGIGNGYSSPTIASDKVFVTGEIDKEGYLFAFDLKGKLLWKEEYGEEWSERYRGTRAAPIIVDNSVYVCSGMGIISCFESETGNITWSIDMINDLNGKNTIFGYSMEMTINDNLLYCFPGGDENNIVALNRLTGKKVWSSKGNSEIAGYGSPLIINLPKRNVLAVFSELSFMGLDAKTGDVLWKRKLDDFGQVPCNKPIYDKGFIYYVAGARNGAFKLRLSEDGSSVEEIWKNLEFDTYFEGIIKIGNHIYGSTESQRNLTGIDINTGKLTETLKTGKGSIASHKGLIYYYTLRGEVIIVKPKNGKPEFIKSFNVNKGTGEHYAYPVIENNMLFIRHGNTILAYDIKK